MDPYMPLVEAAAQLAQNLQEVRHSFSRVIYGLIYQGLQESQHAASSPPPTNPDTEFDNVLKAAQLYIVNVALPNYLRGKKGLMFWDMYFSAVAGSHYDEVSRLLSRYEKARWDDQDEDEEPGQWLLLCCGDLLTSVTGNPPGLTSSFDVSCGLSAADGGAATPGNGARGGRTGF